MLFVIQLQSASKIKCNQAAAAAAAALLTSPMDALTTASAVMHVSQSLTSAMVPPWGI
jgi:hypothetical protein